MATTTDTQLTAIETGNADNTVAKNDNSEVVLKDDTNKECRDSASTTVRRTASPIPRSTSPLSSRILSYEHASRRVTFTNRLLSLMHDSTLDVRAKAEKVASMVERDSKHAISSIDINAVWNPSSDDTLMSFLQLIYEHAVATGPRPSSTGTSGGLFRSSSSSASASPANHHDRLPSRIMPHIIRLVRDEYNATHQDRDGDHCLHLLTFMFRWESSNSGWLYELAESLLQRGIDVNKLNSAGMGPLIRCAYAAPYDSNSSHCHGQTIRFMRLFLKYDADPNQQDRSMGRTVLHWLVERQHASTLQQLMTPSTLPHPILFDLTLTDKKGQTPLQLAESKLASAAPESSAFHLAHTIVDLLKGHQRIALTHLKPCLHTALMQHTPILSDLVNIAVDYCIE